MESILASNYSESFLDVHLRPLFMQETVYCAFTYEGHLGEMNDWSSIVSFIVPVVDWVRQFASQRPIVVLWQETQKIKIACFVRDNATTTCCKTKIYQQINSPFQINLDSSNPIPEFVGCFIGWIMYLKQWDLSWLENKFPLETQASRFWLKIIEWDKTEKPLSSLLYDHHHKIIGF